MTSGRVWAKLSVATAIALSACDAGEPKQDMAFVEGCWVLRWNSDESVSMRTHIVEDEDGRTYRGIVREFGDAADPGKDNYEFIFERNGRWLEMDNHAPDSVRRLSNGPRPRLVAETLPPELASHFEPNALLASFRFEGGDWVIVGRAGDDFAISKIHADGQPGETYVLGSLENCDQPAET